VAATLFARPGRRENWCLGHQGTKAYPLIAYRRVADHLIHYSPVSTP
jgi:hypothetical protein